MFREQEMKGVRASGGPMALNAMAPIAWQCILLVPNLLLGL